MLLETEIKNNFVGCYDEARGVALSKAGVLKNKKSKCLSYMERKIFEFIIMFVTGYLLSFLVSSWWAICLVVLAIFLVAFMHLGKALMNIYKAYKYRKEHDFKSSIIIDKNGITDESYYGIKMTFSLDKILAVVVGKYTVTVLTDTPVYFYFPVTLKDEVIKTIKKYNKNLNIIE